ncbi:MULTISPECIES: hypothetical protein [unclassified Mesorhizobium]|nr:MULTISPECIES: hypothetical protein [unclassified Mesorhizobium]
MTDSFEGATVLITGAAGGLGRGAAKGSFMTGHALAVDGGVGAI